MLTCKIWVLDLMKVVVKVEDTAFVLFICRNGMSDDKVACAYLHRALR